MDPPAIHEYVYRAPTEAQAFQEPAQEEIGPAFKDQVRSAVHRQAKAKSGRIQDEEAVDPIVFARDDPQPPVAGHNETIQIDADAILMDERGRPLNAQVKRNRIISILAFVLVLVIIGAVVGGVCASGFCSSKTKTLDSKVLTLSPTTARPTVSDPATNPPTTMQPRMAFTSTQELYSAVDLYVASSVPQSSIIAERYGFPIGSWDVSRITGRMLLMFSP